MRATLGGEVAADLAEMARLKGNLLAPEERVLLEAYLRGGNSLRQIARLTGMKPSTAWRKVRRIAGRLYASADLIRLEGPGGLSVDELAIVKDHWVRGLPISSISRTRKMSYYRVRNIILTARTLCRAGHIR
jgi:DNA-binding CsgD family transcriptional regulator